jgi:hypothetical protein
MGFWSGREFLGPEEGASRGGGRGSSPMRGVLRNLP